MKMRVFLGRKGNRRWLRGKEEKEKGQENPADGERERKKGTEDRDFGLATMSIGTKGTNGTTETNGRHRDSAVAVSNGMKAGRCKGAKCAGC